MWIPSSLRGAVPREEVSQTVLADVAVFASSCVGGDVSAHQQQCMVGESGRVPWFVLVGLGCGARVVPWHWCRRRREFQNRRLLAV